MTAHPFDFRHPPLGPAELGAREWLETAARLSARHAIGLEWRLSDIGKTLARQALASLADHQLGFALELDNHAICLVVPRPLVLWLLARALGENQTQLPPDRDLTTVERDSLNYLIPQFLEPIRAAYPTSQPPAVRLLEQGRPMVVCRLDPARPILLARLRPTATDDTEILLLFSTDLWSRPENEPAEQQTFDRGALEAAVRQLPLEFTVELGKARMNFARLSRLSPGDVIVLDQPIHAPLRASLSGLPRFQVWPGVIGTEVAVRIAAAWAESS